MLFAAALLPACARTDDRAILGMLAARLAKQYHECVPLGWSPVAVAGTYYPGVSVRAGEQGVWLPAVWLGHVRTRDLARADVRAVRDVLDALARAGMVVRTSDRDGFRYRLSRAGYSFFYDESDFRNNPDHIPYLCYSTIVPQRVLWSDRVHRERSRDGSHDVDAFRAAFAWTPSPVANWANDAFLRRRSVKLGPAENPVIASFVKDNDDWRVVELSTRYPLGRIVDASAWPQPRL